MRQIDKLAVAYQEMVDSVRAHGLWNPILVRPSKTAPGSYEVVDGMLRYTAACEASLTELPCIIRDLSDNELLFAQFQANAIRQATDPIDYAKRIREVADRLEEATGKPTTLADLQKIFKKNGAWLSHSLNLLRLSEPVQQMVQRGEIPVVSAMAIATLPVEAHPAFLAAVKTKTVQEIQANVRLWKKHAKENRRRAYYEAPVDFKPRPLLRTLTKIKYELESETGDDDAVVILAKDHATTPLEGWRSALRWVLSLDPISVDKQRSLYLRIHASPAFQKRDSSSFIID
jgi:ParB/RepB/Spo0J family partition protein